MRRNARRWHDAAPSNPKVAFVIHALSPPLRIELAPSRWLRWAVLALALLAVFAVYSSNLPGAVQFVLPLLAVLAWRSLSKKSSARLVFFGDGRVVELDELNAERPIQAIALHERGVFGVLVISRDGKTKSLPWANDTLAADARRRLRLWMRQHAPETAASWFAAPAKTSQVG